MNIETTRLNLVPVCEKYTEDIYNHFNEKIIKYMFPSVSKNIVQTQNVVKRFMQQRNDNTDYVYAIILKENEEFLGLVGVHNLKDAVPELGIWTKIESHGNHYGREAIGGIIEYAKKLNIKKVCYPVDRRNISSRKIPIYYGGKLVVEYKEVVTSDGRILQEEIYEIDI